MKRIENWENIQESTSFKRLTPNGYICKILKVEDHPEKEYLKIYLEQRVDIGNPLKLSQFATQL